MSTTTHGVDEIDDFGRQLSDFKAGPLTELQRVNDELRAVNAQLEGPWRDTELAEIAKTLKAACKSFNEEISDMITNVEVVSSLQINVAMTLARLNAKLDSMPSKATRRGGS